MFKSVKAIPFTKIAVSGFVLPLLFKEFFLLYFVLIVVLQVGVIKTYCIEVVAIGRHCFKFGNCGTNLAVGR